MKRMIKVFLIFSLLFSIGMNGVLADLVVDVAPPEKTENVGNLFPIVMVGIGVVILLCFGILHLKEKKEQSIAANKEELK